MDVFDSEPYLGLFPKWLTETCLLACMFCLAFVPPARDWIVDQAQRHVLHEIQPFMDDFVPERTPGPIVKVPKD